MNSITTFAESYQYQDQEFDLYVAHLDTITTPQPTVCLYHAWDGLNDHLEKVARKIAELGYTAVAVDLYGKGVRGNPTDNNAHLMLPLVEDRNELKQKLVNSFEAVSNLSLVDPKKMGAVGFCLGGLCVLDLARAVPEGLKGVVSFHGLLRSNGLNDLTPITASILIEHGWDDPLAPPNDYLEFTKEMDQRKADWQAHIHGGVVHSFTHPHANKPEHGANYDAVADKRSWQSMTNFFEEVFN